MADLKTMPRPAFERLGAKLQAESSALCREFIDGGRGDWRPSNIRDNAKTGDEMSVRYVRNMDALADWRSEHDYRLKMHGKLTPWRPKRFA